MKKWVPAFFLTFAVLPLSAGLVYALLYSLGFVGSLAQGFSLEAWSNTLSDDTFWESFGISALISSLVIAISTALALGLIMLLRTQLEHVRVRFLLHFPLALPPMVVAFFSFQWLGSSGMLARGAYGLGWIENVENFPPLINDPFYLGVGLTLTLMTFPFLLLIFMQHYKASNLLHISDLAATLGANPNQIRRRVIAPLLLQRATPTLLLYGVFLFGSYEVPLLLGRQNPAMISMFINQKFRRFDLSELPAAYVTTVVYALFVLFFVVLFLRKGRLKAQELSA